MTCPAGTGMADMFRHSGFTGKKGDISGWDLSSINSKPAVARMFKDSKFQGDVSSWKFQPE